MVCPCWSSPWNRLRRAEGMSRRWRRQFCGPSGGVGPDAFTMVLDGSDGASAPTDALNQTCRVRREKQKGRGRSLTPSCRGVTGRRDAAPISRLLVHEDDLLRGLEAVGFDLVE